MKLNNGRNKWQKLTITKAEWTVYTNENLFFDKKINRKLANIRPSLHFYGMIILVKNRVSSEELHGCHSKKRKKLVKGKGINHNKQIFQARIAQLVAYRLGTWEVPGSNTRKGENFSMKTINWIYLNLNGDCIESICSIQLALWYIMDRCRCSTWKLPTEGHHETCKNLK